MAADKGYANSMNTYGLMLKNGDGIPTNYQESVKYFKLAVDKGSLPSIYNYAIALKRLERGS